MTDDNKQDQPMDGVRLVGRREAEAAIQAGEAISRNTVKHAAVDTDRPPVVINDDLRPVVLGEPLQRTLDLRSNAELPEDVMVHVDGDDELPEDDEIREIDASKLPHWTEPPTGEVPAAVLPEDFTPESAPSDRWSLSAFGEASGLGDTGEHPTHAHEEFDDLFIGESMPFARHEEEFNEATVEVPTAEPPDNDEVEFDPAMAQGKHAVREPDNRPALEKADALLKSTSLMQRVGTAVAFGALAVIAFASGPKWVLAVVVALMVLAGIEFFDAVRRVGYRPPTTLGLLAIGGAILGVYARGEAAIPLVLALATIFIFLWYLTGVTEEAPTANIAVSVLGIVWIGVFSSYAALMLREPFHRGIAFVLAAVLVVIAYDTAAYLGGSLIGKNLLAPRISPGKTWEGLACGTAAAIIIGGLVGSIMHPWSLGAGLLLGVVVSCVAPIGDLAESMIKRDLGLKDMGRLLPGHGGILDRFDALLFVLPATYYLVRTLNLV